MNINQYKNIIISFYISYYYSNIQFNYDLFIHFLNYFRYINIENILYNSITIDFSFNKSYNFIQTKKITINEPLYDYDSSYLFNNNNYKNVYNYNILTSNSSYINYLYITIYFHYNDKLVYDFSFNYSDIIKKNINISFIFDSESFKITNLHKYSPYIHFSNKINNYYENNYNNIDCNINDINNYFNDSICNSNYTKYILKYLCIPHIIKLF